MLTVPIWVHRPQWRQKIVKLYVKISHPIRKYFVNMYKTLQTRYATPVMIWPHCVLCTNLVGIPTTITQQCIQISRKMFEGIIWELLFDFLFTFLKLSGYVTKSGGLGIFLVCLYFLCFWNTNWFNKVFHYLHKLFEFFADLNSNMYHFPNLLFSTNYVVYKLRCNFVRDLYAFKCFFQGISAKTTSFGRTRD